MMNGIEGLLRIKSISLFHLTGMAVLLGFLKNATERCLMFDVLMLEIGKC